MRSWGRGFSTAVDPYRDNGPDEDGDVCCLACGGVFGDLDALRAAGLAAYPEKCRPCRAEDRAAREARGPHLGSLPVPSAWNRTTFTALAPETDR